MMERAEWLQKMRAMAESLYDHGAPAYWVKYGIDITPIHRKFMEEFLQRLKTPGTILDAACGAGLYDGTLVEAGHIVLGIDQSAGMLNQARGHYPQEQFPNLHYLKMGLQDMNFQAAFDGVLCMDAMQGDEYRESYDRAKAMGLPVVYGEQVDDLEAAYNIAMQQDLRDPSSLSGERLDHTVYHYHPTMEQVHTWYSQAGFIIEEETHADEYREEYVHVLATKI